MATDAKQLSDAKKMFEQVSDDKFVSVLTKAFTAQKAYINANLDQQASEAQFNEQSSTVNLASTVSHSIEDRATYLG